MRRRPLTAVAHLAVVAVLAAPAAGCRSGRPAGTGRAGASAPAPTTAAALPEPFLGLVDRPDMRDLALAAGALWVADDDGYVLRVDPVRRRVTGRYQAYPGGGGPWLVVGSGESVWTVADGIERLDPATGRVLARSRVAAAFVGRTIAPDGAGGVWVLTTSGTVVRLDPRGRAGQAYRLPAPLTEEAAIAAGHGAVWVNAADGTGDAARVDLATGRVRTLRLPHRDSGTGHVAVTADAVWFESGRYLVRVDPATGRAGASVDLGLGGVAGMAAVGGTLWVVGGDQLYRIDSPTATVVGSVGVQLPGAVAADATSVWVADHVGIEQVDPAAVVGDRS